MKKYLISIVILLLFGVGIYFKVFIPKHTFKITTPQISNITIKVSGVGNVGSENIYKVSAVYGGQVKDFNIQIGDFVKKGQIIANIV